MSEVNPRADIWNVLHDGEICDIEGRIPGDVKIRVWIPYLRRMFSDDGDELIVTLRSCRKLTMKRWDDEATGDFYQISGAEFDIGHTKCVDIPIKVVGSNGELEVDFLDFALALDNGVIISAKELFDAASSYWDAWQKRFCN